MTDDQHQDPQAGDSNDKIRNYKDHFFQGYFGITEVARGFLPAVVPPAFDRQVDWNEMELVRGAFVDEKLEAGASDLLDRRDRSFDANRPRVCPNDRQRPDAPRE